MRYTQKWSLSAAMIAVFLVAWSPSRGLAQTPATDNLEPSKTQNPSPKADEKLQALKDAMVLLAVRFNDEVSVVPGVIFHRNGNEALIAAPNFRTLTKAYNQAGAIIEEPQYRVILGNGERRKSVPCRRATALNQWRFSVFTAPADRLPPPLATDVAKQPTPGMPVHVIGYESDEVDHPNAYANVSEMATLGQVNLDREGHIDSVDMVCPEAPTLSLAVVTTTSGEAVGFVTGNRPNGTTDGSQYSVKLSDFLTDLLKPEVAFLEFGFESGDAKGVVYEFVAVINDPCHRASEPKLSIQWLADASSGRESAGESSIEPSERARIEQQPPVETLPEAKTLELSKQSPSDAFATQFPAISRMSEVDTLGARLPAENPGPLSRYAFQSQLSYTDESGAKVYLPERKLEWNTRYDRDRDRLPNIPGVDGKPIDCARPVQLADGTYRVTSQYTRVEADNSDLEVEVPQPAKSSEVWGHRAPGVGGRRTITLDIEPMSRLAFQSIPTVPAVFSPDGAWLYLADAKNTVRKISTTDFSEQVYLEFEAPCTSVAYSQAGVVAAVSETIYVLDPETLVVKQTIPTGGVRSVAASPSSGIGFAEGKATWSTEESTRPRTFTQLLMVDFEHGRQIHRIKNGQGCNLRVGKVDFHSGFGAPYQSYDGKHLYLGGHYSEKKLHRFRIDGEDLIYEQTFDTEPCFVGNGALVARKPQSRSCIVCDLQGDLQPKFEFETQEISPVAVDPNSGEVYVLSRQGSFYAFNSNGEQVGELVVSRNEVSNLLPHPEGKRFLGWGERGIVYYDLQADRMEGTSDTHDQDGASAASSVTRVPFAGQLKPFTPGNLLTIIRASMLEVTPQGEVVQSMDLPKPPEFEHMPNVNDVAVAGDGTLFVMYNVEQSSTSENAAVVAQLGPDRKEWKFWSFQVQQRGAFGNIELRNNGEIAVLFTYTDAFLLDTQAPSYTATAIPSGTCMTFGPDGTYYSAGRLAVPKFEAGKLLRNTVCTYDLESLRKLKETGIEEEPVALAVDKEGNWYIARYATITRIAPDGNRKKLAVSKNWSGDAIQDIALSTSGKLAMGSRSGKLFIVDKDLNEESLIVKDDKKLAVGIAWIPSKAEQTIDKPAPE